MAREAAQVGDAAAAVAMMKSQLGGQPGISDGLRPERQALFARRCDGAPVGGGLAAEIHTAIGAAERQHGSVVEGQRRKRFALTGRELETEDRQQTSQ